MDGSKSIFVCDFHFRFQQHIAAVQTFCHIHGGDACHLFPVNDRPLHRCRAAVLGQQRTMNIDTAVFRHFQNGFRQNLSKSCYSDQIRFIRTELFHKFRFFHFFWLQNRNTMFQSAGFYRCRHHLFPSALGLIGLCHHQHHFMLCQQRFQRRHRKIGSPHKNYAHGNSSLCFVFVGQNLINI